MVVKIDSRRDIAAKRIEREMDDIVSLIHRGV